MLYLNLQAIFEAKGIDNPANFLWKNGFTRHTAHNLLYNKSEGINFKHLEKLCLILNCTPNDIFNWQNKHKLLNEDAHPLKQIKKEKSKGNLSLKLRAMSVDKLNELHNFLDDLSKQSL